MKSSAASAALEVKLSKGDQEVLNPEPNNICVLRDFREQGRGLRVYGARCITVLAGMEVHQRPPPVHLPRSIA